MESSTGLAKKLVSSLLSIPESQRNATQKDFLNTLKGDKLENSDFAALVGNQELFNGIDPVNLDSNELLKIDWEEVKKAQEENEEKSQEKFENILYYRVEFLEENKKIEFVLKKLEKPFPVEVHKFIHEVSSVEGTLKELYKIQKTGKNQQESEELDDLLDTLKGIAEVGGTSTYNALAFGQLNEFKKEVTIRKGNKLKADYLKTYGTYISGVSVMLLLLAFLFDWIKGNNIPLINIDYLINGMFIIIGTSIGAWLILAITKREVAFEDLRVLKENKYSPVIKLVVINLIAISFYFMFLTDLVNFQIGDFNTDFLKSPGSKNIAFLVGLFFGLSENTIGAKLTSRVETFVTKL